MGPLMAMIFRLYRTDCKASDRQLVLVEKGRPPVSLLWLPFACPSKPSRQLDIRMVDGQPLHFEWEQDRVSARASAGVPFFEAPFPRCGVIRIDSYMIPAPNLSG